MGLIGNKTVPEACERQRNLHTADIHLEVLDAQGGHVTKG